MSNTVQSTVEGTKNAAESAVNTTKTYVDSAKGIWFLTAQNKGDVFHVVFVVYEIM